MIKGKGNKMTEVERQNRERVLSEAIYIAGPMAGVKDHNFPLFRKAAEELRALGYTVVTPVEINHEPGMPERTNAEYLARDIRELVRCNAIALLPGWEKSVGARAEAAVALAVGMKFYAFSADTSVTEGHCKEMELPPDAITVTGYSRPPKQIATWGGVL